MDAPISEEKCVKTSDLKRDCFDFV